MPRSSLTSRRSPDQQVPSPDLDDFFPSAKLLRLLQLARQEDMGRPPKDLTSRLFIEPSRQGSALLRSRAVGRLCGAMLLPRIAAIYDRTIGVNLFLPDGAELAPGARVARFTGPLRSLLAMERVALNFCTHLSGIATLTQAYVQKIRGTGATVCDTRKTIPGLRELAKYAVVCGGGQSHRLGLFDAVLIKDNHLAHLPVADYGTALARLVAQARSCVPAPKFIEIEVDTLPQLKQVLPCRPDIVLLDNMPPRLLRQAVKIRNHLAPGVLLEASGGVTLKTIAAIARTGVERISVGAITHSAPALDLGLDIED